MASDKVAHLTDDNFDTEAVNSSMPVVVDFHAEWCGPCKMMAPYYDELADELEGKVRFTKLDIDHNPQTAAKYGITGVPTLIMFKEGKILSQQIGAMTKGALKSFIEKSL